MTVHCHTIVYCIGAGSPLKLWGQMATTYKGIIPMQVHLNRLAINTEPSFIG